jgi:hypothetical protein
VGEVAGVEDRGKAHRSQLWQGVEGGGWVGGGWQWVKVGGEWEQVGVGVL